MPLHVTRHADQQLNEHGVPADLFQRIGRAVQSLPGRHAAEERGREYEAELIF